MGKIVPFVHVLLHGKIENANQRVYESRPLPNERRTYTAVGVENRTTDAKVYSLGVRFGGQLYEFTCVYCNVNRPGAFAPVPFTIPEGMDAQLFIIGAGLGVGDEVTYIAIGYSEFIEAD